jgi:hypothetical protein
MAILTGSFVQEPTGSQNTPALKRQMSYTGLFRTAFIPSDGSTSAAAPSTPAAPVPVYRSLVGSEYIYTEGAPAEGFTITTIVGFI